MSRTAAVALSVLTLGCAARGGLGAQPSPDSDDLARLEAAVDSGRVEGARAAVEGWLVEHDRPPDLVARARFLRARLMSDADSARAEYLWVAMDARSSHGAAAWVRLAQLDLAHGEPARAVQDLERLRADYPGSPLVADSWYWSGRAFQALGDLDAACAAWDQAIVTGRNTGDLDLVARAVEASRTCAAPGMRVTVQVGAFSRRDLANEVARRVEDAGHEPQIVEEDGLFKVRVGRFASSEAARSLADRLRAAGFSVAVVAVSP